MKKVIFTSLSPNAESDDIARALNMLFTPWKWWNLEYVNKVEDWFKTYLGVKNVFLIDSGRTGIMLALQAMEIGEGDEVLVQAYTCVAVPNSVLWAGAKPVYVDIDEQSLNISLDEAKFKITEKTKAIVVQHTFGNPVDMEKVMSFAKENYLKVIEDCAHGLGASFNKKPLGSYGDAAIFSFGRDKVVSAVFGGAVVVKDDPIAGKMKELFNEYKKIGFIWTKRQLVHPIIFWLSKNLYNYGPIGKILIELSKRLHLIAKAVYPEERLGRRPAFIGYKLNNALATMEYYQLLKLEKFVGHRRSVAQIYDAALDMESLKTQQVLGGAEHSYLRYYLSSDKADLIMTEAKKEGILLGDWYRFAIAPSGVDYDAVGYKKGSCPVAEMVAQESINLPTHIGISKEDAIRVADLVKKYL
jgi:perosamine synthetase